jgi:hypothetical protein
MNGSGNGTSLSVEAPQGEPRVDFKSLSSLLEWEMAP